MTFIRGVLKVLHPSDIITKLSTEFRVESVLANLSLIGTHTHGLLIFDPYSINNFSLIKLLDVISVSDLIKEATPVHGDPPVLYIVKQSFGVQKALADVRAIRPSAVLHSARGVKHFWITLSESNLHNLVKLVKRYATEIGERRTAVKFKAVEKLELRNFIDISMMSFKRSFDAPGRSDKTTRLTSLEYYVLKRAYELGYFDWPRRCSLECLSENIGLSKATIAEHLRKAVKKLLSEYF